MRSRQIGIYLPLLLLCTLVITCINSAEAYNDRYIRLRYVDGDVSIFPADRQRPTDATVNSPLLDGDELETRNGKAELAFRNGVVVRIGDETAIRLNSSYSPVRIELLRGSVFVDSRMVQSFREELEVQAGDAQVYLIDEGNMRIDLGNEGGVRVTSINGEAEVRANGRRVLLDEGERTYIDPANSPESPNAYDGRSDDLDDWNESRMGRYSRSYNNYNDRYLDQSIYYDSYDLYDYGDWRSYNNYGNVWVPRVSFGWRPYQDGRWMYSTGGWFWVSYEPWGWAPYHYGRWGWDSFIGWYWIPGTVFAPSWVSWYDYGDYIGWCPLNYYDRPNYGGGYGGGVHYPPIQKPKTMDITDSWTFIKKKDIGSANIKKTTLSPMEVKTIKLDNKKVVKSPHSDLVNYVIPTTVKTPAYVNDKSIIKKQPDIKSGVGINHRYEDPDNNRGNSKDPYGNNTVSKSKPVIVKSPAAGGIKPADTTKKDPVKKPVIRDNDQWDRPSTRYNPGKNNGSTTTPVKPRSFDGDRDVIILRDPSRNGGDVIIKSNDRDGQFDRPSSGTTIKQRHSGSYVSPYFKDVPQTDSDTNDVDLKNGDTREVTPRYSEEAKKIFQRFDDSRKSSDRPSQRDVEVNKSSPPPKSDNRSSSQSKSSKSSSSSSGVKPKN